MLQTFHSLNRNHEELLFSQNVLDCAALLKVTKNNT